jgi:F0F1-type ATP synthase delta subunit
LNEKIKKIQKTSTKFNKNIIIRQDVTKIDIGGIKIENEENIITYFMDAYIKHDH